MKNIPKKKTEEKNDINKKLEVIGETKIRYVNKSDNSRNNEKRWQQRKAIEAKIE